MGRIRVLVADDHTILRQGLVGILKASEEMEVVGEAAEGSEAVEKALKTRPDVVVLDISMPRMNGLEAARRIREALPATRILVLTMHDDEEYVLKMVRAGASGYLLKEVSGSQLTNAIRTVADGFSLIYPSVARRVLDEFGRLRVGAAQPDDDQGYSDLTPREREVLKLIASGRANKEIGTELGISERTVKTHISNIFSKLQLTDRTQAALYVHNRGLLEKA
jgi:DNA-binding NarL/FixJ family response regulator